MYRETGYQMSLHGNVINQQKVGRVLQKEGDHYYCVYILCSYCNIYRVAGLSCPEAGVCLSAILRGFPDVFSFFGP